MRRKENRLSNKSLFRCVEIANDWISPIIPSSTAFLAVCHAAPKKVSGAEPRYSLFSSASFTNFFVFSKSSVIVFSVYTCFPASNACSASSKCVLAGVKITTISISGSASISSTVHAFIPYCFAFICACSRCFAAMDTTSRLSNFSIIFVR